jgi:hypothetical protein
VFAESYIKKVKPELFSFNLHILVELPRPEKLPYYKDSYLYCKKISDRELYYVKLNGTLETVPIEDFEQFETNLSALKKRQTDTWAHLSAEQIVELITKNGGYVPTLQLGEPIITQILPPLISHRNYGRRSFVELFRAYTDIECEFERLAEVRQHGREIFNAATTVFQSREEVAAANLRAEEERRRAEEERRRAEEERRRADEDVVKRLRNVGVRMRNVVKRTRLSNRT